jgi:hypothetical protein
MAMGMILISPQGVEETVEQMVMEIPRDQGEIVIIPQITLIRDRPTQVVMATQVGADKVIPAGVEVDIPQEEEEGDRMEVEVYPLYGLGTPLNREVNTI